MDGDNIMSQKLSVFRNERKYIVTHDDALSIKSKFDRLLMRDEHAETFGYIVRSLYFDSVNNEDYMTKLAGTEIRKKIRIRTYSPDSDSCKLEAKLKNGDLQHKVSLWITKGEAYELCRCNYSVLIKYFSESEDAMRIYMWMVEGCYRPVVLIEYDRIAYTFPLYNTRLTIDMNIRSSESNLDLFSEDPMYIMVQNNVHVLEVKYNEKLMKFISDVLKQYNLTQCSVSKYCMGRKIFQDFIF